MIFSCSDSASVSSMKRNNKILMTLDCFVFIAHNSQSAWNVLLKTLVSDRNFRVVLMQPTVVFMYQDDSTQAIKFNLIFLNKMTHSVTECDTDLT